MRLSRFIFPTLAIIALIGVLSYKIYCPCPEKDRHHLPYATDLKEVTNLMNEGEKFVLPPAVGELKIVHVFTTWCGCCKKEVPEIKKLTDHHKITGLVWSKNPDEAKKWLEENGNHYSEVGIVDDSEIAALGVVSTPLTIVIDHKSKVLCTLSGPITKEKFDVEIAENCLKKKLISSSE